MPNTPTFDGLKRVNITIEGKLHAASVKRAKTLGLADGFSGLVSRLLVRHNKTKGRQIANSPRRFRVCSENER